MHAVMLYVSARWEKTWGRDTGICWFCLLLPTRRTIDASVSEKLLLVSCQTTITGIRPADIKHGNIALAVEECSNQYFP